MGDTLRHKRSGRLVLAAALIAILAFAGGLFAGVRGLPGSAFAAVFLPQTAPDDLNLSPLWRAWHVINEKYVPTGSDISTVSDQERIWGMIQGLAASLGDPYTVFLPPSEAEVFQADISGSFEGVGMEIALRDGILTVVSPLRGTPAERAGIKSGDRILEIDNVGTRGMDIDDAVGRIRGKRGTVVEFSILREGESDLLDISVVRDIINIPTLESEVLPDGIFVVRLMNFSAVSPNLFRSAMRDFATSGRNKLILDLRGNPGGFLNASVDIASYFLPEGAVVVTEDFGDKREPIVHRSRGFNLLRSRDFDAVILVDRGSASASEILAGALKHHGVATLIGNTTFGKGSVQEVVPITSDTALKVTVARWVTPNGEPIPDTGIVPDVEIEVGDDAPEDEDVALQRAVEFLITGK